MRLLLLTAYFPPDTGAASHLFYDLGAALAARGHQITVVTCLPGYHTQGSLDRYRGKIWLRERFDGMEIVRVAVPRLPTRWMAGRAVWQFGLAGTFLLALLCLPRLSVALVYSPPLTLGFTAWGLQKLQRTPFILNVQDIFPQSVIDLGILRNPALISLFRSMEGFLYRQADLITVHSEGNKEYVLSQGGTRGKVHVVPNWVDTKFIKPGERVNDFRSSLGLGADTFIISFTGVLGYSQDLDVVLETAGRLKEHSDILWLIVGEGVEKARLETNAVVMNLDNVRFLPMQPREKYPAVLHASDVCLVTLRSVVRTPVVPSKILTIMAAGRPVVAAMDPRGDAPRLIEASCCGLCLPPGNPQALGEAVLKLYHNPGLRCRLGENGRAYAEQHFSLQRSATIYEGLFSQVASR